LTFSSSEAATGQPVAGDSAVSVIFSEFFRKIGDGFGINRGFVPSAYGLHIRGSLPPGLAFLPTVMLEEVRGRSQDIGLVMDEIASAIAVEIHCEFQIGRRHELRLSDFARPGAARGLRVDVTALNKHERVDQFASKLRGPPAIPSEGRQRF